jgi:hypothetical protein
LTTHKWWWLIVAPMFSYGAMAETVKLSRSNICHDENSPSYNRTKYYTPYPTIGSCIAAGGRLPRNQSGATVASAKYSRKKFKHWVDDDGDCINTRHEVLIKLSLSPVRFKTDCFVGTGHWLGPYTGLHFHDAGDLDIDHLVPLKWAWDHGAKNWTASKRKTFANDESNLFAVKASVNRTKGARGPTAWLPHHAQFHCRYITEFMGIVKTYGLTLTANHFGTLYDLRTKKCSSGQ